MLKGRKAVGVGVGVLLLLGTACASRDNFRDIEGVKSERPDVVRVFNNVDKHPNVTMLCIHGVGFATTTRTYGDAIMRVPEWDSYCKEQMK